VQAQAVSRAKLVRERTKLRQSTTERLVSIDLIHIAPWSATRALLRGASSILSATGILCLYGPYRVGGKHTSASNRAFDAQLQAANPEWGVRDLDEVSKEARAVNLELAQTCEMPANNMIVVFRKG
jgi:Protein of unknown function (DUF938)